MRIVDAGAFSSWLATAELAVQGRATSDVPCGTCTACCRASQFVHVGPDEHDALSHIPAELLFPAPGTTDGTRLLGYDERGHCPMLVDDRCSIYEHRPRACRTYDCRVFPAAGVDPGDGSPVAEPARRWRFDHPEERDRVEHDAVHAAAGFLDEHHHELFGDAPRPNPTQRAVMAVRVNAAFREDAAFREQGGDGTARSRGPVREEVLRLVRERRPRA